MEEVPYTTPDGEQRTVTARVVQIVRHKTEGQGACFVTIVDKRTSRFLQKIYTFTVKKINFTDCWICLRAR